MPDINRVIEPKYWILNPRTLRVYWLMWPHTYIEWTDCQKETPSFIFSAISASASKSKSSPIGITPARKTGFVKTHNYAGILAFCIRLFCFNVIQLLSVAGTISNATASPPTAARLGSTPICSFLSKRPLNSGVDARINLLEPDRMMRMAPWRIVKRSSSIVSLICVRVIR